MAAVTAVKSPDTGPAVKEKRFYLDVKWVVILAIVAFLRRTAGCPPGAMA